MKDREIMERALKALNWSVPYINDAKDTAEFGAVRQELDARIKKLKAQEEWYSMSKEARDKIRMAQMGNRNLWKPELDPKFEKAKELRASGLMVKESCKQAGITVDQWYRRLRIEKYGRNKLRTEIDG